GHANYLMLRNHGLLTVGRGIGEAFLHMYTFESACQIQIGALAGGAEVIEVGDEVLATVKHALDVQRDALPISQIYGALKRKLDRRNPGYDQ
ncbi:MAG: class II aldolase/adducin family protein, partial [Burkholderiaceae bacterium]